MIAYKGYVGIVQFDADAHLFHGDVVNTRDVITFQGRSVKEIETAFHASIDDYLRWCAEEKVSPERPYSGKFNVRLSPELHKEIAVAAKKMNLSMNRFLEKAVIDQLSLINS